MSVAFSQFCSATPAVREALRRRVDDLGRQGRSCEFADCRMPAGCVPRQAALGFLHREGRYLLYWRPAVAYRGQSPALSALFARSAWRFDSYEAMTDRLASLRREAEPPASPWPPLYRRLREELGKQVLGQDRALEAAAFRLYSHVGKRDPARPLSLVLHGPTGVGKSELGKALAPALERCCGQPWQRVWTELNTFTEAHTVHRLTGAPPGYVGYEDQPVFEAVRRNPRTVFMFDELEKAHPEVLKVFMSILDEGRCTARKADETGNRELDFRRCVFVFTTNADLTAAGGRPLGFSDDRPASRREAEAPGEAPSPAALAERLFRENEEARRAMVRLGVLREIAGRFSGIIGFQALDGEARRAVTVKQIRALGREYGLDIVQVDPDTARALTPGRDALSVRSSACVLESLLAPLLTAAGGRTACRLAGLPGGLRLLPAYSQDSSTTALAASSS